MKGNGVELLIATGNAGKAREFREMLGEERFVWRDLSEFTGEKAVAETGATFRANACLKASGYAVRHGMWTLADDSGLEVDALGGKPRQGGEVGGRGVPIQAGEDEALLRGEGQALEVHREVGLGGPVRHGR